MDWKKVKRGAKKFWEFIWESDSPWSWLANIVLAFIIIKFIVYPFLGLVFATSHPIVAVVSGSMEHKTVHPCMQEDRWGHCVEFDEAVYEICGRQFPDKKRIDFDSYWSECGSWYESYTTISKEDFSNFPMKNGFNTGDLIILRGTEPENIKVGDIIVYSSPVKADPIIHRVVEKEETTGSYSFKTKGDHNSQSFFFEREVSEDSVIGNAWLRIPFLGYVKIWFVRLLEITGIIDLVQWIRG